ncbi:MAG: sel1 repeat family protein, partial [Paramuribaculum sp.]|nr:sel1 repeat family protein [Paramuribaculum sp.]
MEEKKQNQIVNDDVKTVTAQDVVAAHKRNDREKCFELALQISDDPVAACYIGYYYQFGYVVGKDLAEAFKWYRRSAAKGYVAAQTNLAYLYR